MHRMIRLLLVFSLLVLFLTPALAQSADIEAAVGWLQDQKLADGGYSDGFSEESGVGPTTETVFAAVAAGTDVSIWGSPSPLDYLAQQAGTLDATATIAQTVLAAVATGQSPRDFDGTDLLANLNERYDAASGTFEGTVAHHAYAMLALHNAGEDVPAAAVDALKSFQADDGGWAFDGTSQSETNTTAIAIQALVAAGESVDSDAISSALDFLRSQQNEDGGFPYQAPSAHGTETDANSTAWVIQALRAADQNLADWNNPEEALAALQMDNGAFQWKESVDGANFLATAQAVPALAGVTYVDLPTVTAAQTPSAEAPATIPETGQAASRFPIEIVVAGIGILLVGAGFIIRRRTGA